MSNWMVASDFDGTLATRGVVDPLALSAIKRWRAAGGKFVIVTGRILADLFKHIDHKEYLDAVVAEDGAVLWEPGEGARPLAPPPPPALVAALRKRKIPFEAGSAVLFSWKPHEKEVLDAIRDLGLEHHIVFNWDAVMIVPPGITKGVGCREVAKHLGIDMSHVAAIGDGENDHALLRDAGRSAAVSNAVPSLKKIAQMVTDGERGAGVAEFITTLMNEAVLTTKIDRREEDRVVPHRRKTDKHLNQRSAAP